MRRRNSLDSNDDESESLIQEHETQTWDVFKDPPRKYDQGSQAESKLMDIAVKVLKSITYIVVFCVVLSGAVISKGTLLFMTSQIKKNITRPYCNKKQDVDQQFIVSLPDVERTVWIWLLIFVYLVPQLGTFIRSARILTFKSWERPTWMEFLCVAVTESLSAIGSSILIFAVLPELDVIRGAMLTNAMCFAPALFSAICFIPTLFTCIRERSTTVNNSLKMFLHIISLFAQATALIVWPLTEHDRALYMIPVSILLISLGWWENYIYADSPLPCLRSLGKVMRTFENSRYYTYVFVSLFKCFLFLTTTFIILYLREDDVDFIFSNFNDAFSDHTIFIKGIQPIIGGDSEVINYTDLISAGAGQDIKTDAWTPVTVMIINVFATYVCYTFGKFSCKVQIQGFSYAFSINLAVPVLLSILIAFCGVYNKDECYFADVIPPYLFWNPPPIYFLKDFISQEYSWLWLLWLLSQAWITVHIWTPRSEKLASTEKLYVRPMYDAYLIDQSVALNRRRDDASENVAAPIIPDDPDDTNKDSITRIYACGTMWHETKEEMMEFLKSVFRMDEDQCAQRIVRTYMSYNLPTYYELETHIFFDDAFVRTYQDDPDPHVNEFVEILLSSIDDAASEVHETRIKVKPPKKYITPYGGKLEWTLPGKTKMIAHLKDKKKIRSKKRWSQVMYMYYLLGHRLMDNDLLSAERKNTIAENTFILALDGDIDFQPQAVHLLVDYMKKNKGLGAACGRIHPIGSGAMVWYQMFEYAVGHWLQKATEHVFGCVLCSPGCFSLFRGKALMDDSVMKKYTTKATEARHYVQYDQGEDRWLCTLLLQRGYRVEYSAASDAYTHCPEGFNEFYNQRRRWMPSTTANILDLLTEYKHTVKINDNISKLYIAYQGLLMIGTVLGPGNIFLMLVGAFVAVFQLDQWQSFFWNLLPILIFVVVCATCKSDTQLFVAGVISAIYGLIMMAVIIGVLLEIQNDGIMAPSSLFFFCISGEFILAAILHPKEFNCLKYGIVYYVTVPSMYMLLVIYSVFNMNNVSWGTREVTVVPQPQPNAPNQPAPPPKKKENTFVSVIQKSDGFFASLCSCCRPGEDEKRQLWQIQESVSSLNRKLDVLEMSVLRKLDLAERNPDEDDAIRNSRVGRRITTTHIEGRRASRANIQRQASHIGQFVPLGEEKEEDLNDVYNMSSSDDVPENSWLEDGDLSRSEIAFIPKQEMAFWNGVIDKYLHPIDDTENKAKVEKELQDLRDKMVFTFLMLNALFVLVVFLLTLKKDLLHINWPITPKVNFTYNPESNEVEMYKTYLELEPIGFVFLIFFGLLLITQFIGMCMHRFATFCQIIANTDLDLNFFEAKIENLTGEQILEQNPLKIARKLQKLKGLEDNDEDKKEEHVTRRKTVLLLAKNQDSSEPKVFDLDKAFQARMKKLESSPEGNNKLVRRDTVLAIRRRTEVARRRTQLLNNAPTYSEVNT